MKKFVLASLVLCSSIAYAQHLTEGYVVKTSGDTIRGFLNERFDWSKADAIEIANSPTGTPSKVRIDSVDQFYVKYSNSFYLRRKLELDKKPTDLASLERTPARKFETEIIFIRQLARGRVNLFDYTDDKPHYFIQKDNGEISELAYVRYAAVSGTKIVEMPYFVAILQTVLSDCDKVGKVSSLYQAKPLKRVVEQYNSCFTTESVVTANTKGSTQLQFFAGGGLNFQDFAGSDKSTALGIDAQDADFSSSTTFVAGVSVYFMPVRPSRFNSGFQIQYMNTGTSNASYQFLNLSKKEFTMAFSMITVAPSFKFHFIDKGSWKTYVRLTPGAQILLSSKADYVYTDITQNTTITGKFLEFSKFSLGGSAAVGTTYNRLSIEVMYSYNIAARAGAGNATISTIGATVGYRVTRK